MKKILLVMLVTFNSLLIFGQGATATIPNLTANPGSIVVPVNVTGFDSIVSINMYFEYDPAVVTYSTFSDPALSGMLVNAFTVGSSHRIGISWSASEVKGSNVSGTLVNIVFNYISGTGNFTFLPGSCLVKQRYSLIYNTVSVTYTNGSINPSNSALISIPQLLNQAPANGLSIPLNVDFSNIAGGVNAFTFIVEYDATKLVYQGVANNILGVNVIPQTVPTTRLSIQWEYVGSPGSSLNGKLIDMVFNYIGGTSPLAFDEGTCNIADNAGLTVPGVYSDGLITQATGSVVTVTAGTVTALPGTQVLIPVTVDNFTNIGAFDLDINFNQSVLSYIELININPLIVPLLNLASNATPTGLGINWDVGAGASSGITIPPGGKLFDIKFNYVSGSTPLTFTPICFISDFSLIPMTVNYVNGLISQTPVGGATAILTDVLATPLSSVEMPVNVTGFTDLGAFDMVVSYNTAVLDFTDVVNINPALTAAPGSAFSFNATGGKLYISWTIDAFATSGVNITDNDKLFDLKFYYKGGTSDLVFDLANCLVTKFDGITHIDVSYFDGSIGPPTSKTLNLNLFLEGLFNTATGQMNKAQDFVAGSLTDKYSGTVADHIIVELHDAAAYSTIVYQVPDVELNQDGTAAVTIPSTYAGNYYITVKQRNHIETLSAATISFASGSISYNFTTLASQAFGNNQKLLAAGKYGFFVGDVNQDGSVNATDRSLVNSGVIAINKGYIAEDVNGDGGVNATDRSMVNSAVINIVQRIIP